MYCALHVNGQLALEAGVRLTSYAPGCQAGKRVIHLSDLIAITSLQNIDIDSIRNTRHHLKATIMAYPGTSCVGKLLVYAQHGRQIER